jgi:hypothetical protein
MSKNKRNLLIVAISLFIAVVLCSTAPLFAAGKKNSTMPYAKKCEKCIEARKKDKTAWGDIGIAHRDFGTPNVRINGKAYTYYVCCYGHRYLVPLDNDDKK